MFQCHYCLGTFTILERTIDHIVPKSLGGVSDSFNLVDSCAPCNVLKADKWPDCTCDRCRRARRLHSAPLDLLDSVL